MTYNPIQLGQKTMANSSPVVLASDQSAVPVSGTFWQATQPVSIAATVAISAASLPLPTGAATAAKQPALGTAGSASSDVITVQGIASMTALKVDGSAVTQPVSGTVTATLSSSTNAGATAKTSDYDTGAGTDTVTMMGIALPASGGAVAGGTSTNPIQVSLANTGANSTAVKTDGSAVTQPVSAASLPLPTGAATAAKQPALGTAGTASSDVITVQGIASMTALKVDGSAVTQPVSGTVTASNTAGNVASGATDSGNPVKVGGKYNSTPITLTDGQRGDVQLDANGYLKVNIASGAAAGGTSSNFGSALPSAGTAAGFSDGTNMQAGHVFDVDTGAGTQYVQGVSLRKAASGGSVEAGTSSDPLRIDPTGTTAQPITDNGGSITVDNGGTFAVQDSQVVSDNAAFTDGTTKVFMGGYILDETAGTALTENDAAAARIDSKRAQVYVLEDATTRGRRATVSAGGALLVDNSANTQPISGTVTASNCAGDVASGSADSGNPVKTGGVARTTNPTAVSDGQRVNRMHDKVGRTVVVANQVRDLVGVQQTTITSSTSETTIVTAVASTFCDLVQLTITNSSATALIVTLKDSTAGTTRGIYALAANGGITISFPTPLPQASVNTSWTLTCGSSVDSIYVVAQYVKNT